MARRLGLPAWDPALQAEFDGLLDDMNRARLAAWRSALDLAATDMPPDERLRAVTGLAASLRSDLARCTAVIDGVQKRMERASRVRREGANLLVRSALAAGFTLFLAPASGCYSSKGPSADDAYDAGDSPAEHMDYAAEEAVDAPDDRMEAPDDGTSDDPCTPEEVMAERQSARWSLRDAPCPPCAPDPYWEVPYGIAIDAQGRIVDVRRGDGAPVPDDIRACYLEALAGETFPCLGGEEVWQECMVCLF
jgi:hypothetical protein